MLNRFVIIIAVVIKSSVNLLFSNGFKILNFLPIDIDPGVLKFDTEDGYMVIQSTPHFSSERTLNSFRKYFEENFSWDHFTSFTDLKTWVKGEINSKVKSMLKHPQVQEQLLLLKKSANGEDLDAVKQMLTSLTVDQE